MGIAKSGSPAPAVVPEPPAAVVPPVVQLSGNVQPEASHHVVLYPVVEDGKVQVFILVQPANVKSVPSVEQVRVAEPV